MMTEYTSKIDCTAQQARGSFVSSKLRARASRQRPESVAILRSNDPRLVSIDDHGTNQSAIYHSIRAVSRSLLDLDSDPLVRRVRIGSGQDRFNPQHC